MTPKVLDALPKGQSHGYQQQAKRDPKQQDR